VSEDGDAREGPTIAFGPVGLAGLVALAAGLVRRRPLWCLAGAGALAADALVPGFGGMAARNRAGEP